MQQIQLMDYSLNRIRRISSCRLLLGGFHLGAHERIQIEKNADREESAAEASKDNERNRTMAQKAHRLQDQAENQNDSGEL